MTLMHRRTALGLMGSTLAASTAAPLLAASGRRIPEKVAARVIVDNDYQGDPDGLVGLTHQLLSPRSRVTLVTSSFLSDEFKVPGNLPGQTARQGRDVAAELIARLKPRTRPLLATGAEGPVKAGHEPGPAARAIVAEAMRDDPLPLFFTCGGPLTNLAQALALEPRIAGRLSVIWIGGGAYPDGAWEYNLAADPEAARAVIEGSAVPLWQVPQPVYRQMQFSLAELAADMRPISPFSRWLFDRFTNPPDFVDLGGSWPMGDSPLLLITALSPESSTVRTIPARRIAPDLTYGAEIPGRTINLFDRVDARLIHADFLARLRLHAAGW